MGAFYVFKIVQMLPNRETHFIWIIFNFLLQVSWAAISPAYAYYLQFKSQKRIQSPVKHLR